MEMRKFIFSALLIVGLYSSAKSEIITGSLKLDGILTLENSKAHIRNLEGSGLIKGENFYLSVDEYNFLGSIEYAGNCFFKCKKAIDYSRFVKNGDGSLTIIIRPYDFKEFNFVNLVNEARSRIAGEALLITDKQIENSVNECRYYAYTNSIDEKKVFSYVLGSLDERIKHAKEHENDKFDPVALEDLKLRGFMFSGGLVCAALLFKFIQYSQKYYIPEGAIFASGLMSLMVSGVAVVDLPSDISKALNPQFKFQLPKYEAVRARVTELLSVPFVFEEEQIIRL